MPQAVDRDNSGSISADELQQALLNNNWSHFNSETCRLMVGMFDKDRYVNSMNYHKCDRYQLKVAELKLEEVICFIHSAFDSMKFVSQP